MQVTTTSFTFIFAAERVCSYTKMMQNSVYRVGGVGVEAKGALPLPPRRLPLGRLSPFRRTSTPGMIVFAKAVPPEGSSSSGGGGGTGGSSKRGSQKKKSTDSDQHNPSPPSANKSNNQRTVATMPPHLDAAVAGSAVADTADTVVA